MGLKISTKKGLRESLKHRGLKLIHGYNVKKRKISKTKTKKH